MPVSSHQRALSLDLWRTLIASNPAYKPRRDEYLAQRIGQDIDALSVVLRAVDVELDALTESTGRQYSAETRLGAVCERMGLRVREAVISRLATEIQQLFLEYPVCLKEEGLIDVLLSMRKTHRLAVTSNTGFIDGRFMRKALEAAGLRGLFDVVTFSNELGIAKPAAGIFRQTASDLGVHPWHVTHVGDNLVADYQGALAAGMGAVLIAEGAPPPNIRCAESVRAARELGYFS